MVADAPEVDDKVAAGIVRKPRLEPLALLAADRAVVRRGPVGQDLRAVVADPDEFVAGERALAVAGPAAEIGAVAALGQDLDETPRVPEGIEVDGGPRLDAELPGEVAPAEEDLADERFAARHVAVGLDVPAAHDVPLLLADELADPAEERRLVLHDPAVEHGLVVTKDEALARLAELGGLTERGQRFAGAFLPFPEPDRVEMGVRNEVDPSCGHGCPFSEDDGAHGDAVELPGKLEPQAVAMVGDFAGAAPEARLFAPAGPADRKLETAAPDRQVALHPVKPGEELGLQA